MSNKVWSPIAILIGIWVIWCCVRDSDFYFNHRKVRFLVDKFGRNGARLIHLVLGILIIILGIAGMLGAQ